MVHELKILSKYFEDALTGNKPFELRKNDRDYKVGDILALNEVSDDKTKYTGNSLLCEVTYVLDLKDWLADSEDYVILGIRKLWIKFRDGDRELVLGKGRTITQTNNNPFWEIKEKFLKKSSDEIEEVLNEALKNNDEIPFGVKVMKAIEKAQTEMQNAILNGIGITKEPKGMLSELVGIPENELFDDVPASQIGRLGDLIKEEKDDDN